MERPNVTLPLGTRAKLAVTTPIVRGVMNAVSLLPARTAVGVTKAFYGENGYPEGQAFIDKSIATLKHIFKTANATCKMKIIENMVINEGIVGQQLRGVVTRDLGFDVPVLVVVSPTQRCPLKCYGCYSAQHSKTEDLSFEAFDRLVTDAKAMGIYFFVITGGEPYVYEHLFPIFEKHSDVYFQTYTSGVTIAERGDAKRLAQLGNVLPCISIEGFEEETDRRRGAGHFKRIRKAMTNLRAERVPFGFSATVTRENNEKLMSDELVDFYIEEGCSVGYYFQYMPIGREPAFELVPTPEQRMHRLERVIDLRRRKPILLADFWCDGPLVGGCLAGGRRYLHVNNQGHAEPCVFAQAWDMSVYEHSLLEILRDSQLFGAIRRRQPYSDNLLRPCMIIDVPECWRDAVAESGATLSHQTADNVAKELREKIEAMAGDYAELADPVWRERYEAAYRKENDYVRGMREKFAAETTDG